MRVLIAAGRTVVEPLVSMLSDQAANLRMHAALALGELQAQEATPDAGRRRSTIRTRTSASTPSRRSAASARPNRSLRSSKIAASDNFFLAFAAIDALSKTDDARVAPLMVSLLDQELLRPAAIDNAGRDWRRGLRAGAGAGAQSPGRQRAGADRRRAGQHPSRATRDDLGAGTFIIEAAQARITAEGRARLVGGVDSGCTTTASRRPRCSAGWATMRSSR